MIYTADPGTGAIEGNVRRTGGPLQCADDCFHGPVGHPRHEFKSGSMALLLAGLLPGFPPDELLRPAPVQLHTRNEQFYIVNPFSSQDQPGFAWYFQKTPRRQDVLV